MQSGKSNDSRSVNESGSTEYNTNNVLQRESQFLIGEQESKGSEGEVDSESIKVKRDAMKRILIDKAPPILTIHLKRFSQDARGRISKLNGHMDFRDTFDLKPYMHPRYKLWKNKLELQLSINLELLIRALLLASLTITQGRLLLRPALQYWVSNFRATFTKDKGRNYEVYSLYM